VPNPIFNIWVQISSSPACSVMVQIHSATRCNEINVITYDAFIWIADPPGCATQSDISNSITAGVIKEAIYLHLANFKMFELAMDPYCCPCPNDQGMIISKTLKCQSIALQWTGSGGILRSVTYDPSQPWSFYQNMIDMSYGFLEVPPSANPYFSLVDCLSLGCCFKTRYYCRNTSDQITFTDGAWQSFGSACNTETTPPCIINNCNF